MNETYDEFVKRKLDETLADLEDLKSVHLPMRSTGIGLCDIGAKIAFAEGKLEMLRDFNLLRKE